MAITPGRMKPTIRKATPMPPISTLSRIVLILLVISALIRIAMYAAG